MLLETKSSFFHVKNVKNVINSESSLLKMIIKSKSKENGKKSVNHNGNMRTFHFQNPNNSKTTMDKYYWNKWNFLVLIKKYYLFIVKSVCNAFDLVISFFSFY